MKQEVRGWNNFKAGVNTIIDLSFRSETRIKNTQYINALTQPNDGHKYNQLNLISKKRQQYG